jgi:putative ABC transport system ATP-binding protein
LEKKKKPMESDPPIVRLSSAEKYYLRGSARTWILREADLSVRQGDFVALTGPSGSGKSTLLNILGLTTRLDSGHVFFKGIDVARMKEAEIAKLRRAHIGYVFQNFNLLTHLNSYENIMLPLEYQQGSVEDKKERVHIAMDMTGVAPFADALPHELSGGQQQRVAIARAIVTKPDMVLADEPTGNLDAAAGNQIMTLLKGLNESGMTIIYATHSIDHANRARHRYDLSDGVLTPIRITQKFVEAA